MRWTVLLAALLLVSCETPLRSAKAVSLGHYQCGKQRIVRMWDKGAQRYVYFRVSPDLDMPATLADDARKISTRRLWFSAQETMIYRGKRCRELL